MLLAPGEGVLSSYLLAYPRCVERERGKEREKERERKWCGGDGVIEREFFGVREREREEGKEREGEREREREREETATG